jgi:tryptophanase
MQAGFINKDFPLPVEPTNQDTDYHHNDFRGNLDLEALRSFLLDKNGSRPRVFMIVMTITNNMYGGQPVSMRNLRDTRQLCDEFDLPLWFDGCRMNENAYFIQ